MYVAFLEEPSPGWMPLEFGTDTLPTNGDKTGSGTGSCLLPLAGSFFSSTTTESPDEMLMLDLSDFQALYRKYRSLY